MTLRRRIAWSALGLVSGASLFAEIIAPYSYSEQFREEIRAAPSWSHPLGTDDLGRDRFSRLLYGTRISLLLAPAAALLATAIAAGVGLAAGYCGGLVEVLGKASTDLFLSLPWLFLLLTVRAMLPLDTAPLVSVVITFALLGALGWAAAARVVSSAVRRLKNSEFLLQARSCGCRRAALLRVHLLPNVRPVLAAQFWLSIPVLLLTEANLGLLGLGVSEPLPSWGNLLRELEDVSAIPTNPWLLAPALLLLLVVGCLAQVTGEERVS